MIVKNCLFLALLITLLTSCSSLTQITDPQGYRAANTAANTIQRATFLDNTESQEKMFSDQNSKLAAAPKDITAVRNNVTSSLVNVSSSLLESLMPLQFKYAIMMNATVENLTNVLLYQTIDQWFGTRYRYGGTTRQGIDCSAFMQVLSQYVFGLLLPRTAHEQFAAMISVDKEDLHEGDLVFFGTRRRVSHVGMYLQNNKFVHSCTSKGVSISDLDDTYWVNKIVGYKRLAL